MPALLPRLIAYGLIGLFCIPGSVGLLIALNMTMHRAEFIRAATRTDGMVTWMEPVKTTRTGAGTYTPVFRFSDSDGGLHLITSDVSVPFSTFSIGDRVQVLYLHDNPDIAHIDAFSTLWQDSLVVGMWGVVWSCIPVFILVMRRRRHSREVISLST